MLYVSVRWQKFAIAAFVLGLVVPVSGRADCTVPFAIGGTIQFFTPDLKYCDGTNWQTIPTGGGGDFKADGSVPMTGSFKAADGTAAAPSITFNSDQQTGFYLFSGNSLSYTSNGVERVRFSNNGLRSVTTGSWSLSAGVSSGFPSYTFENDTDTGMYRGGSNDLRFATGGSDAFRILGSSNAYISNGLLRISSGSVGAPAFGFENDVNTGIYTNADGMMGFSSNGSEAMRVHTNGNIGIGITNPGYILDVGGDINIASASALRFGGTSVCTSAGCTATSDRNLKENIAPLEDSLQKVLLLQGVEYDFKDKEKYSNQHQIGVIAQDVEEIYPEVVMTDSKTGLKSVAYGQLVAPLIEAIKTMHSRQIRLERENAQMKARIERLEESLSRTH